MTRSMTAKVACIAATLALAGATPAKADAEIAFGGVTSGRFIFEYAGSTAAPLTRSGSYTSEGNSFLGVTTGRNDSYGINSFYVADITGLAPNPTSISILYGQNGNTIGTPTISYGLFQGNVETLLGRPAYSATVFGDLQSSPALASVIVTQSAGLRVDLGPGILSAFNAALSSGSQYLAVGATSGVRGGGGVGAPGPVAGAGLPFLLLGGVAWLMSRRKAHRSLPAAA